MLVAGRSDANKIQAPNRLFASSEPDIVCWFVIAHKGKFLPEQMSCKENESKNRPADLAPNNL